MKRRTVSLVCFQLASFPNAENQERVGSHNSAMETAQITLWITVLAISMTNVQGCPERCNCTEVKAMFVSRIRANCSHMNLTEVPSEDDAWDNTFISTLTLSYNNITTIHHTSFFGMDDLVFIDLEKNGIIDIEPSAFDSLPVLMAVDLSRNNITYLHPETFFHNQRLLFLDLSYNPLLNVPSDKAFLMNYGGFILKLSGCNIQHISEQTFSEVNNLLALDLSFNDIPALNLSILSSMIDFKYLIINNNSQPLNIQGTFPSNLQKLDLSGNTMDMDNFPRFPPNNNLLVLVLSYCNLTELPKNILNFLTNLEELVLDNNKISKLEISTVGMRNLVRLDLENNDIHSVEADSFSATRIWKLVLNKNPIDFPESGPVLKGIASLEELQLRSCAITQIGNETFKEMNNINFTDLSHNRIKRISNDAFNNLEFLTTLLLQNNVIEVIEKDAFLHNVRLSTLNLSGNPLIIPNDTPFLSAPSLKTLALVSCGITNLPLKVFSHSVHINNLDVSHNKLESISDEVFSKMRYLRSLNMSGNPFVCDYKLRPLWLQCLDRGIECSATCGSEKESWNLLEDVTSLPENATTELSSSNNTWISEGVVQVEEEGPSVTSTVMLMLSVGALVGLVVGAVIGCLFLERFLRINRHDDGAVYHSVAAESITAESLQHLCIDDST